MAELTKEDMRDLIREQTQNLAGLIKPSMGSAPVGGGGSSGGGFSLGSLTPGLNTFNAAVGKSADGLSQLYNGTANVSTAFGALTGAVSKVPIVGESLAKLGDSAAEMAINSNNAAKTFGKVGANFDQDLTGMNAKIRGAGMTTDEYSGILSRHSKDLAGLGSTTQRTQDNFLTFGKNLRESGVMQEFAKLGMTTEDVNEIMLTSSYKRYNTDLSTEQAQKRVTASAQDLAVTIDENARLYGISREAQTKEIQTRLDNVEIQAELMGMDQDAQDRYMKMSSQFAALGPAVGNLTDEIFTGGVRTKQGADLMAALGPAGSELEQAVLLQKEAVTDQQKQEAQAAMERATARVLEFEKTKEFREQITLASGSIKTASKDILAGNQEAMRAFTARQAEEAERGKAITAEEGLAGMKKEARGGMTGLDKEGQPVEKASVGLAQTLNQADAAMKDQAAGLAINFDKVINSSDSVAQSLNNLDQSLKRMTAEEAAELQKNLPGQIAGTVKSYLPSPISTKSAEEMAAPISRASGSPTLDQFLNGTAGFDQMFEHFKESGSPAILHGEELVANKDQMKKLFSKFDFTDQFKDLGEKINEKKSNNAEEQMLDSFPPQEIQKLLESSSKLSADQSLNSVPSQEMQQLLEEIATGGITTADSATLMSQLGDVGPKLASEVNKLMPGEQSSGTDNKNKSATDTGKPAEAKGFFEELTSTISDTLNIPDITKTMYGIGDDFGKMYDSFTRDKPEQPKETKIVPPTNSNISEQAKAQLGTVKKPEESGIQMANEALKDVKTTISAAQESKKETIETPKATPAPPPIAPPPAAREVTLNEVYDILVELNSNISRMTVHTEAINNASNKQVRETKKLSGNRFG